jgi:hypothetical protein
VQHLAHLMRAVRQVLHAVRDQHRLPSRSRSWRP